MSTENIYHSIVDRFHLALNIAPSFNISDIISENKSKDLYYEIPRFYFGDYFYYYINKYHFSGDFPPHPTGPEERKELDIYGNPPIFAAAHTKKERLKHEKEYEDWQIFCVYTNEGRLALKRIFVYWIQRKFENIEKGNLPEYINEERARSYLDIGKTGNFSQETLESLVTFNKMYRLCYDEELFKEYEMEMVDEANYSSDNSEKYTWEDSYRDAGGGDEWSDPSEFW